MIKKKNKHEETTEEQNISKQNGEGITDHDEVAESAEGQTGQSSNEPEEKKAEQQPEPEANPVEQLQKQIDEAKDKYLRLSAEFDNYRKRTLREKMDLSKYASEEVLLALLPVIDDFDRALKIIDDSADIDAVKQGIHLIYSKFGEFLKTKGVVEIDAQGKDFNTDQHEAITKIQAQDESMKGKVVDVVQKGYLLNDKVMRYSKVVVGE